MGVEPEVRPAHVLREWTTLAEETHDRTTENYGDPVFQRRQASPLVGLEVIPKRPFSPDGFLGALSGFIPSPGIDPQCLYEHVLITHAHSFVIGPAVIKHTHTHPRRLQILHVSEAAADFAVFLALFEWTI